MAQQIGPQATDESRIYSLTLTGTGGSSLLGHFTGSEVLTAYLWPGGTYASAASLTAAWDSSISGNPATVASPVVSLTINASVIASLAAGTWQCKVIADAGSVNELLWEGSILLTTAKGVTVLPRLYSDYAAMVDECSWLAAIESLENVRAAQFLPELSQASQWVEQEAMARWERDNADQLARHGPIGYVAPIIPTDGVDAGPFWGPSTIPNTSLRLAHETFSGYLDTYGLMTAYGPDRGGLRRLTALYALYLALDDQLGNVPGSETNIQTIATKYREKAIRGLFGVTFYVDVDDDGVPDFELGA